MLAGIFRATCNSNRIETAEREGCLGARSFAVDGMEVEYGRKNALAMLSDSALIPCTTIRTHDK